MSRFEDKAVKKDFQFSFFSTCPFTELTLVAIQNLKLHSKLESSNGNTVPLGLIFNPLGAVECE